MARMGKCDFSEFKKLAKALEKEEAEARIMVEKSVKGLGNSLLKRTKNRTKEKTGNLKRTWTVSGIKKNGKYYRVIVSNNQKYAPYVEYGHRTRNHKGWVPGRFMLTKSLKDVERLTPRYTERRVRTYLEEMSERLKND